MDEDSLNCERNCESGIAKRLKNLTPFQPGHEPKGGRPKGSVSIKAAIERKLKKIDPQERRKNLDIFVDAIWHNAVKKRLPQSQKHIMDSIDGLPRQPVDLGVNGAIQVDVISEKIKNDPEATAIATRLLEQITAGKGDAGGPGIPR